MIPAIIDLYSKNLDYAGRLVADLPDASMCHQPGPGMNHPAWVLGHLAWTSDRVAGGILLQVEPELPKRLGGPFDAQSVPSDNATIYPAKAKLLEALEKVHGRIAGELSGRSVPSLDEPTQHERFASRFPTIGEALIHVMVGHEQVHLGQLSAWRRVQGMASV
ncbi:MAG: hypothetical protein CMJ18_12685 [Phycisphaeraceae bacterium]|nr:hypothetical protein [Phycisphaeraceae bacterium]